MNFIDAILTKRFLFTSILCLFLLCAVSSSCKYAQKDKTTVVEFALAADSGSLMLKNFDYAILHNLKTDSISQKGLQDVFPVFRMPADTDMKDLAKTMAGNYTVGDSTITFKPDTPFKKHCLYFARFYSGGLANSQQALVQSTANLTTQKYREFRFSL